ncbi:MAG TPA: hypothetical protein VJ124_02055 [Pyrinomonadaceae bacterium]|nr:hypothetical protein [Pyrinomonadaceae bacterium]
MTTVELMRQNIGDWVFITPIGNLKLSDAVNHEFKINRVLFVSREKLPRIRKRLGISVPFSEIKKSKHDKEFFEIAETYAVVRYKGNQAEMMTTCFMLVRDELSILATSQLGYKFRRFTGYVGLLGEHRPTSAQYFLFKTGESWKGQGWKLTRAPQVLVLDKRWKNYQRQAFFSKLLDILSGKIHVSDGWRKDLTRATILIGQSLNSTDVANAFLWNMIALELLLTKQGDRYTDVLPKRIEAFLGWIGFWASENYEERIREAYRKRCDLVHRGDRDAITRRDLLFSDDLLLNVLINIVNYIKLFDSKEKIIEFAEKVEAEHRLGQRSKVRPKRLRFFSRRYSEEDFEEI